MNISFARFLADGTSYGTQKETFSERKADSTCRKKAEGVARCAEYKTIS